MTYSSYDTRRWVISNLVCPGPESLAARPAPAVEAVASFGLFTTPPADAWGPWAPGQPCPETGHPRQDDPAAKLSSPTSNLRRNVRRVNSYDT